MSAPIFEISGPMIFTSAPIFQSFDVFFGAFVNIKVYLTV